MLFRNILVAALASVSAAEIFSFAEWVDGIVANPDGDHLSPEEAVAAWEASVNNTEVDSEVALEKRMICNRFYGEEAKVTDAVWCIDYLARKGAQGIECKACANAKMCRHGAAMIWGAAGGWNDEGHVSCTSTNCNDVAHAAGLIMDSCTRADGTVHGSEYAPQNKHIMVHISKPF